MKKQQVFAIALSLSIALSGCGGMSAKDLTDYYANQAKDKAVEAAKDAANTAASEVNKTIDENETASKVKKGVGTAGEYAQDAYDYVTDENTQKNAKETAKQTANDTKNFFEYMINKLGIQWGDFKEDFVKAPEEFDTNAFDDMENISEYDFYGNYKNIFKEAKGIDTSGNGTAMDQLKVALGKAAENAKQTSQNIKQYHDERHPDSSSKDTQNNDNTQAVTTQNDNTAKAVSDVLLPLIPAYDGTAKYCVINDNVPFFDDSELTTETFETYSELDSLGRCGVAYANICKEIMPTEERGSIGSVKPTGFIQKRYECLKDDENPYGYMYARCHLIAYTLAGENANEKNLITGSFFFNLNMEEFELMTSYYIKSRSDKNPHVLYRTTPLYSGNELVARGVLMEARSVENNELSFCVFVYNAAPGIEIDYATGESKLAE